MDIFPNDRLEGLSDAALGQYVARLKATVQALKGAIWDAEQEQWMREDPARLAARAAHAAMLDALYPEAHT